MPELNNELFKFVNTNQVVAVSSIGSHEFLNQHQRISTQSTSNSAAELDTPYFSGGLCIPLPPDNGPMVFPYNPTFEDATLFPITLKLPLNKKASATVAIPESIADLQCFFIVQNMPWGVEAKPLLRPHNWLHPDARESRLPGGVANQETSVRYKLFKNFDEFNLHNMHTAQFSTHLAGHSRVVYSPNNASIEKNFIQGSDQSTSFYSLVVNGNKAALTLHWLLNAKDYELIHTQINQLVREKQIKTLQDLEKLKLDGMQLIKFDTDEAPKLISEVKTAAANSNSAKGKERQLSNNNGALPDPSNQVVTYDGYGMANPNLLPYGLADLNQYKLIKESFETFGLELTPTRADGNCFYYCLAHVVNETTDNLRQLAADLANIQFQSMGKDDIDLCLTELKSTHQSYTINNIEEYINLVRNTLYADQFTIDLLSKYYNLPIYVFEPNSSEFGFRCKQTYLPEQTPNLDLKEPLFVLHVSGDHFHLLKPLSGYITNNIVDFLTVADIVKKREPGSSALMHPRVEVDSSSSVAVPDSSSVVSKNDSQTTGKSNLGTKTTNDVDLPEGGSLHQKSKKLGKQEVRIRSSSNRSLLQQQLTFQGVYMPSISKDNQAVINNLKDGLGQLKYNFTSAFNNETGKSFMTEEVSSLMNNYIVDVINNNDITKITKILVEQQDEFLGKVENENIADFQKDLAIQFYNNVSQLFSDANIDISSDIPSSATTSRRSSYASSNEESRNVSSDRSPPGSARSSSSTTQHPVNVYQLSSDDIAGNDPTTAFPHPTNIGYSPSRQDTPNSRRSSAATSSQPSRPRQPGRVNTNSGTGLPGEVYEKAASSSPRASSHNSRLSARDAATSSIQQIQLRLDHFTAGMELVGPATTPRRSQPILNIGNITQEQRKQNITTQLAEVIEKIKKSNFVPSIETIQIAANTLNSLQKKFGPAYIQEIAEIFVCNLQPNPMEINANLRNFMGQLCRSEQLAKEIVNVIVSVDNQRSEAMRNQGKSSF
jgi:hypothetical protein